MMTGQQSISPGAETSKNQEGKNMNFLLRAEAQSKMVHRVFFAHLREPVL